MLAVCCTYCGHLRRYTEDAIVTDRLSPFECDCGETSHDFPFEPGPKDDHFDDLGIPG